MSYIILIEKDKIDQVVDDLKKINIEITNKFPLIGLIIAVCIYGKENDIRKIKGVISIEESKRIYPAFS